MVTQKRWRRRLLGSSNEGSNLEQAPAYAMERWYLAAGQRLMPLHNALFGGSPKLVVPFAVVAVAQVPAQHRTAHCQPTNATPTARGKLVTAFQQAGQEILIVPVAGLHRSGVADASSPPCCFPPERHGPSGCLPAGQPS
mmetsp:Transcript_98532/g.195453  ORF Transcript_98532/g.195453 Transcript_98532/m.195453 type:complete len:140 (+) Transcript_98532:447-866(+)